MAIEDHPAIVKTITWQGEDATQAFAALLARRLQCLGHPVNALIELRGDLGAGKTTLARHLFKALGVTGRIKSPTYAVVEPYTVDGPPVLHLWHFDFYRFNDPDEWEEAGFRDIFAGPGIKLVEWPEKAGAHLPAPDLVLGIEMMPDQTRCVTIEPRTLTGRSLAA